MKTLFNNGWNFAELQIESNLMYNEKEPVLLQPESFLSKAELLKYNKVTLPH